MVTAIEQVISIFKPQKCTLYVLDKYYIKRINQKVINPKREIRCEIAKLNLTSIPIIGISKNDGLQSQPPVFKSFDEAGTTMKMLNTVMVSHKR